MQCIFNTQICNFIFINPLTKYTLINILVGFPFGSDGKESAYNARDPGLTSGSRRSPGEGTGNPLQHSCLEDPMDRGATESDMTEQLERQREKS